MLEEAAILERHERLQDLGIELGEGQPVHQGSVRSPRRPQLHSVAILEGQARNRRPGQQLLGQRPRDPRGECEQRARGDAAAQSEPAFRSGGHGAFAVTVKAPPSERPCTAGLYISSACAGGSTNTPGVVARATYVAVWVPFHNTVAAYTTRSSRISL